MVLTDSTMLPLGTEIPTFSLRDAVSGRTLSPEDVAGERGTLVMFLCNHCPYVQHVLPELRRLAEEYRDRGIGMVAINANDIDNYPQDSPENMKELAESEGWGFPFLMDDTQEVAKAYRAACTPDFFVFDADDCLVYRGRLDGSRPGNDVELTGEDLRAALDALLQGETIPAEEQKPSAGCNIKWKQGNEPDYFG
ncbi:MAG: thioredoxin family protein [Acidobacteriota bacterium]